MLDIGPSKSNPGLNDYLYICQVKACAVEKEYSTSPGGFLFGFAEAIILEPLCERVLKSLQVVDGYCLPHGYRDLSIRGCGVRTNRFGRALPRLVLANDQKTIIARTEVSGIQSELIRSIRDICGNLKSPEVIRLAPSEMDAHFREVSVKTAHNATATNGWAFLPSPHAFYSPSSNTVFMTDRGAAWSSAAITASDIDALRDAGLFHECVHAWQQQNLLARGAPAASDLVVNAILEGHAEFCTREYLTRKGQSALRDRLLKEKRDYFVGLSSSDQAIASRFMYVDGLRFFEFLSRQNPPLGIRDVFERGLPTERQILLPEEYLHPRQASAPPFAPWLATLQRLFGTGPGDISTVSPAGFRAYVEQISAVPKDRTTLLVRMIDGKRAQRGNFMATLLAFESSDDASRTFYLVTRDHERRRRIKLSDPAALPDRGGACSHYTPPEGGTPTVAPVWASGVGVPASAGMSCCPRPPHYQHGK
jgi:hypothetical protein